MNVTRYRRGSGMATSVRKETTDYKRDGLNDNLKIKKKSLIPVRRGTVNADSWQ